MNNKVIYMFLSFSFAIGTFIVSNNSKNDWLNKLNEQSAMIAELNSMLNSTSDIPTPKVVTKNATGVDVIRLENDKKIADEFIEKAMSWDSYEKYVSIREDLSKEYKLDEKSSFFTIFFPEVPNREVNGVNYNRIDYDGLNVNFEESTQYLIDIKDDSYSYFSLVEWNTNDGKGNVVSTTDVFMYTIDKNGNVKDIDAFVIQ